ncbi:MAG TPA: hypothetical protein VGL94_11555 [Ktedonobacteraceae bacterium]
MLRGGVWTTQGLQTIERQNVPIGASRSFNAKDREQLLTRQVS